MWHRKKTDAFFIASLLGAALAAGAVGVRTAPVTSSACRRAIIPGGANEPMPVESGEWRVESPAKAAFFDLSTLDSPLSTEELSAVSPARDAFFDLSTLHSPLST